MEMNLKTGQQEKFLLIYFAFPGALTQQEALELREERQDKVEDGPSMLEELPRLGSLSLTS